MPSLYLWVLNVLLWCEKPAALSMESFLFLKGLHSFGDLFLNSIFIRGDYRCNSAVSGNERGAYSTGKGRCPAIGQTCVIVKRVPYDAEHFIRVIVAERLLRNPDFIVSGKDILIGELG